MGVPMLVGMLVGMAMVVVVIARMALRMVMIVGMSRMGMAACPRHVNLLGSQHRSEVVTEDAENEHTHDDHRDDRPDQPRPEDSRVH